MAAVRPLYRTEKASVAADLELETGVGNGLQIGLHRCSFKTVMKEQFRTQ